MKSRLMLRNLYPSTSKSSYAMCVTNLLMDPCGFNLSELLPPSAWKGRVTGTADSSMVTNRDLASGIIQHHSGQSLTSLEPQQFGGSVQKRTVLLKIANGLPLINSIIMAGNVGSKTKAEKLVLVLVHALHCFTCISCL